MKAPIHHTTSARKLHESCWCGGREAVGNLAIPVSTTAATSKINPMPERDSTEEWEDFHSRHINEMLTGRINNRCVYWLSRTARPREEVRGFHQTIKEIAVRTENSKGGDNLKVDSLVEPVSTIECFVTELVSRNLGYPMKVQLRLQLCELFLCFCRITGIETAFQRLLQLLSGEHRLTAFRVGHTQVIVKRGIVRRTVFLTQL